MGTGPLQNVLFRITVDKTPSANFISFIFNSKKIRFFTSSILPYHKINEIRFSKHLYTNRTAHAKALKIKHSPALSVTTRPTTDLAEPSNFVDFYVVNSMGSSKGPSTASVAIFNLFFLNNAATGPLQDPNLESVNYIFCDAHNKLRTGSQLDLQRTNEARVQN